ncbi:restriction endonuclease subunit S [Bacillus pumilus]|uniref:restriction endonuclease subunit S n=1 Tax=Bacillus pumilus TaxID=1408 RepID=UPI000F80DCC9|nr:restriction endonuclease subunit S [Bacillus pumilus]
MSDKIIKLPQIRFAGYTDAWEQRRLGDHADILTGGTPSTSILEYWEPKEIPWMSSGEVNKRRLDETDNMISEEGLNNSSARWVKEYSVLIALAGQGKTRGTVAINNIPLTTNQSIAAIVPDETLHYEFIFQNLIKRYTELRLISSGDGTRGGLNKQIVSDVEIPYTSIEEQEKIGAFFANMDHLIILHQRELELLKDTKKSLLQKMFPKDGANVPEIRFAGFTDAWEQRKLSKGMTEYTERVLIEDDKVYKQVSVKNIGKIILRGEQEGSKIGRKRQAKVNLAKHPNTLIFTRQTIEQGGIGFAPKETDGAIVTENMPTISVDTNVFDRNYIITLVKTRLWRKKVILSNIEGGTAQIAIHEDNILKSEVLFPKINEQQKIGIFFKQLDDTITLHQRELNSFKNLKKSLLQQMFI